MVKVSVMVALTDREKIAQLHVPFMLVPAALEVSTTHTPTYTDTQLAMLHKTKFN